MSNFNYEGTCTQCNYIARASTKELLEVDMKAHNWKKHPANYSLAQGYSEIDQKTNMLRPVKQEDIDGKEYFN